MHSRTRGFTLIELLVVISIIGIMSSVVLSALQTARQRAQDNKQIQSLTQLQRAMELYYDQYGVYPALPVANLWRQNCWDCSGFWAASTDAGKLAALAPYMTTRPSGTAGSGWNGYFYKVSTDQKEYMIILLGTIQSTSRIPQNMTNTTFLSGTATGAAIYSSNTPKSWTWWSQP